MIKKNEDSWTKKISIGILSCIAVALLLLNLFPVGAVMTPDLNGDLYVDTKDVTIAARSFGASPEDEIWNPNADLNRNGEIDLEDLCIITRNFGPIEVSISSFIEPEDFTVILRPGETIIETIEVAYTGNFDYELGTLRLTNSEGYDAWLTGIDPIEHLEVWTNTAPYIFEVTITVPDETSPGNYTFQIIANTFGNQSTEEVHQEVNIQVPPERVIPEVPIGTILASATMIIALLLYATKSKWKKKISTNSSN